MSEMVTSAGQVGFDFNRSEGRAYATLDWVVNSGAEFRKIFEDFGMEAQRRGRRRWVLRAVVDNEARIELGCLPSIEVDIPLYAINPASRDRLVLMAENVHRSEVPEWEEVSSFWQNPYTKEINPTEAIPTIEDRFRLTDQVSRDDVSELHRIWIPFGWSRSGVEKFIDGYQENPDIWFSGVRDVRSGKLISACQGEGITFANLYLVEGTEYGTLPGFEGQGLCTAAVIGLHAQILQKSLYKEKVIPLIYSELNMTTRADVIARKAGMSVPLVEGRAVSEPRQVLRRNVSVFDDHEPNDIRLEELGEDAEHFRDAYGMTFPYWRNFLAAILPREAIDRYYSEEQCQQILEKYHE